MASIKFTSQRTLIKTCREIANWFRCPWPAMHQITWFHSSMSSKVLTESKRASKLQWLAYSAVEARETFNKLGSRRNTTSQNCAMRNLSLSLCQKLSSLRTNRMLLSILNNLSTTKRYSNTYKEMSFRAPRVLFTNLFPVSMREKNN